MAVIWYTFYGGYDNSGPYNNVVLCGSPNTSGPFGVNLQTAHNAGYGKGIGFDSDGYNVIFYLDLVGISVTDAGVYVGNSGSYVPYSGPYNYILKIELSNNNQVSYTTLFENTIFTHPWQYTKTYSMKGDPNNKDGYPPLTCEYDWTTLAANSKWSRQISLPTDTTHVRVSIRGEDATFPYEIVFEIEEIVQEYRPMAVRKGNAWNSLDHEDGFLQIRKSGAWDDIPLIGYDEDGESNTGSSRIRKAGVWRAQSRIGA